MNKPSMQKSCDCNPESGWCKCGKTLRMDGHIIYFSKSTAQGIDDLEFEIVEDTQSQPEHVYGE